MSTTKQQVGWDHARFREILEKSGLRREVVASSAGCSLASLYQYAREKGSEPSINTAIRLADFFGVPLDYLCGRCDEETARRVLSEFRYTFRELSRGRYESVLLAHSSDGRYIPVQYRKGVDAPYPYNLLDDIVCTPTQRRSRGDYWQDVITPDQEAALQYNLSTLKDRERELVLLYYREGKTLEECGKVVSLTRERVRQFLARSVRLLRHPSRMNLLLYGLKGYEEKSAHRARLRELEKEDALLDEMEQELIRRRAFLEGVMPEKEPPKPRPCRPEDITLEEMDLSVRSFNCLARKGCRTLSDVRDLAESGEMLKVRNLGRRSLAEVLAKVQELCGEDYREVYAD